MNPAVTPFSVKLAGRDCVLKWTNAARYWLSKVRIPPVLSDLSNGAKHNGFICDHVWAALDESDRRVFINPSMLLAPLQALDVTVANDLWQWLLMSAYDFDLKDSIENPKPLSEEPESIPTVDHPGEIGTKPSLSLASSLV